MFGFGDFCVLKHFSKKILSKVLWLPFFSARKKNLDLHTTFEQNFDDI